MFEILAKSGKLVKVSELDMGYVDESGTVVLTKDMTEEQHKAMAEYYKFIVKKYFRDYSCCPAVWYHAMVCHRCSQ